MKKIITLLTSVVMLVCVMLLVACGGGSTFNGNFEEADSTSATSFATSVAQANNQELSLDNGIVVKINESKSSYFAYQYTIKNFEMKTYVNGETVIASGKFDMVVSFNGQTANDSVKFYHDGEYLAMEIREGSLVDKQKSRVPLVNICALFGDMDLLDEVLGTLNTDISSAVEHLDENNKCYIEDGETSKKIKLENAEGQLIVSYDANYKIIGAQFSNNGTVASAEVNTEAVTLPDFNEFTARN